jgi:hypothetical protein
MQSLIWAPVYLRYILMFSLHLRLSLSRGLFPVDLPGKISKALLASSNLASCPVNLNLIDLFALIMLGEL